MLLVLFTSLSSNYVPDDASLIPKPSHEPIAWQGLTDLRESLLERGMLNEAIALFKVERSRLPVLERADASLSFRSHIERHASLTEERSAWLLVELNIYLAQSFHERHEVEKGRFAFGKAAELLQRWCVLSNHQDPETLAPQLEMSLFQLRLLSHENPVVYFNESMKLLKIMKTCCYTSTTVCYLHAAEAADSLAVDGVSTYREQFFALHQEREAYQERVQENICSLLSDQLRLFQAASNNVTDLIKALEWVDHFMEKYKDFNIPRELINVHRFRENAWMRLNDSEKRARERAEVERFTGSGPTHYGRLVGVRQSEVTSNSPLTAADPNFESEFPLDIDEDQFYKEWTRIEEDIDATQLKAMQLTQQWILNDIEYGVIQKDEVLIILGLPDQSGMGDSFIGELKSLSPESTFARIFRQGINPAAPVSKSLWEIRFSCLKTWLSRPSLRSARNSRQFLVMILQELREHDVAHSQVPIPLDEQVLEIERCFDTLENLPPRVKEAVAVKAPTWHGNLARRYISFATSAEFGSDQVGVALEKAEEQCHQSIKLHQEMGDVVDVAFMQRTSAEVCALRIHWLLRQPGKVLSATELSNLQGAGLRDLEKAESFFSSRHQESAWSSNLEDLEARDKINLLEGSWRVALIALQLLRAGDFLSDEDRGMQTWNWVQRSKARSLAMTMGVAGIMPSTLRKEISASEKCRLLYDKMVSLQEQIQSVEPQQRFWLRRELDLHILEMRKEELLREVCDLWDGRPLTSSDLDRITAIAKTPVVLVDWIHVPAVFTGDGSLLLLTAQSGRTPTVTTLETTIVEVEKWIYNYLDSPYVQRDEERGQSKKPTDDISSLVQPLIAHTQPGDMLVFCPTTELHRVPLHAVDIEIDGDLQPLIYRNPIVYSYSHSLLRICLWNSQLAAESPSRLNPLTVNGIPTNLKDQVYSDARKSIESLAHMLGARALLDASATKAMFMESAPASRLIHVHTHVHWNEADALMHHIDFSNSESAGAVGKLTAREIFSMSLIKGSHVSLIACSGGRTRIDPKDAVMGLVPALLRSGASSTISTLWKIPGTTGARFTEAFYRHFLQEREALPDGGFVNMAKIFQLAVREVDEVDQMRHWTSLVIHGFWSFFMPGQET